MHTLSPITQDSGFLPCFLRCPSCLVLYDSIYVDRYHCSPVYYGDYPFSYWEIFIQQSKTKYFSLLPQYILEAYNLQALNLRSGPGHVFPEHQHESQPTV